MTLSKSDILNRCGLAEEEEVEGEELWLQDGGLVAALPPPSSYITAPTATTPLMSPQTSGTTFIHTQEKSHSPAPCALFLLQPKTDSQHTFVHTLGRNLLSAVFVLTGLQGRIR